MKNKVWYYQSGPKSVSINPYGIPEPPKPFRNCRSLDWARKTKKFESLGGQGEFLMILQGCIQLTPLWASANALLMPTAEAWTRLEPTNQYLKQTDVRDDGSNEVHYKGGIQ